MKTKITGIVLVLLFLGAAFSMAQAGNKINIGVESVYINARNTEASKYNGRSVSAEEYDMINKIFYEAYPQKRYEDIKAITGIIKSSLNENNRYNVFSVDSDTDSASAKLSYLIRLISDFVGDDYSLRLYLYLVVNGAVQENHLLSMRAFVPGTSRELYIETNNFMEDVVQRLNALILK